ncbi:hypothetical protein CSKR_106379 [Clonorchis sinensis]|uniref:Uncharacterized protein n=1 Tax=Clonorchis sinensis TaxID=79923 RepID=A0A3R7GQY4_CLOSI|nr:hypothetical protein CSKR_106379 [Clonorchis sinensis]
MRYKQWTLDVRSRHSDSSGSLGSRSQLETWTVSRGIGKMLVYYDKFSSVGVQLGQPGSILALVLPSGGMSVRHRNGATAEQCLKEGQGFMGGHPFSIGTAHCRTSTNFMWCLRFQALGETTWEGTDGTDDTDQPQFLAMSPTNRRRGNGNPVLEGVPRQQHPDSSLANVILAFEIRSMTSSGTFTSELIQLPTYVISSTTSIDHSAEGPQSGLEVAGGQLNCCSKSFSCITLSVSNCHATRRKHEGWDTTRSPKPRQEKSRCRGWVRTKDIPAQSVRHTGSGVRFNGKNVHSTPCATHKSVANLLRKKAGTISAGQLGDHVRTNTIIVVNSMVGYQASFRFTPLATFLTREPHESLLCTGWNWLPSRHHEKVVQLADTHTHTTTPKYMEILHWTPWLRSGVEVDEMAQWLEREFTDRRVRWSNPTYASRLPLSRLGRPGSIPALVLPSGGIAAMHRKGVTAERLLSAYKMAQWLERLFTDRKVRISNPTSASRLPSGLGQAGSIPALMLTSGGVAARHRKGLIEDDPNILFFFSLSDLASLYAKEMGYTLNEEFRRNFVHVAFGVFCDLMNCEALPRSRRKKVTVPVLQSPFSVCGPKSILVSPKVTSGTSQVALMSPSDSTLPVGAATKVVRKLPSSSLVRDSSLGEQMKPWKTSVHQNRPTVPRNVSAVKTEPPSEGGTVNGVSVNHFQRLSQLLKSPNPIIPYKIEPSIASVGCTDPTPPVNTSVSSLNSRNHETPVSKASFSSSHHVSLIQPNDSPPYITVQRKLTDVIPVNVISGECLHSGQLRSNANLLTRRSVVRSQAQHPDCSCPGLGNPAVFQPSCLHQVAWQLGTERM